MTPVEIYYKEILISSYFAIYPKKPILTPNIFMPDFLLNLSAVAEKLPHFKADIELLIKECDSFRILCEDYLQCSKALQYWCQSDSEEAPLRRREYASILRELEVEILENLTESDGKGNIGE